VILDTSSVDRDVVLDADVCVVGSGAGGSVVAMEVSERGRSVVVVEEGPYLVNRDFTQREEEMYPRLFQEDGARSAMDSTVVISQGRTVGGSSVVSYCVCARPPRSILDSWRDRLGVPGVGADDMLPHFQRVERAIEVSPIPAEQVNRNNQIVQAGAERLGFGWVRLAHNRVDCLGCGYCALGCAYDRKRDTLTHQLRIASDRGAIVIPDCRVDAVTTAGGRASGVSGTFRRTAGKACSLRVEAKVVILAAGAIGSPQLWLRSGLPNSHRQVGRNLRLHPQVMMAAVFAEEVAGWRGIPQSIVVDEFLVLDSPEGGFLLAPTFLHPMALACSMPGFGRDHRRLLEEYSRLALSAVMLHDRSSGNVEIDDRGRVVVSYQLNDDDRVALSDGMRRMADIYFASGAERVVLPFHDLAEITRRGDYSAIDQRAVRSNDPLLLSLHPQGTLRMGVDPRRSVVNSFGEAHGLHGLLVADASVFPGSVAVPPQLSVMAFASRTAQHLVDAYFPS
jgi:choline dehydrogenase-like flavoprotein